jgi:hypothetical protein
VADIVIVLCRLMTRTGRNLGEEVARKMAINRARQWNLTADGHGYHVRDKSMFSRLASAMMKFAPDLAQELVNRCQDAQRTARRAAGRVAEGAARIARERLI